MEKFKLTNLRELSNEEQLHLNGGLNSEGCSSCGTCSCGRNTLQEIKDTVVQDAKKQRNE